jgi:hypothetical protein
MRAMQIQDYAREYQAKSDGDLLQLAAEREHLTVEAGVALEGELARRKISVSEQPIVFQQENKQPDRVATSSTEQRVPDAVGQFVADVLKVYHDHFWFFFQLTVPVVAVS